MYSADVLRRQCSPSGAVLYSADVLRRCPLLKVLSKEPEHRTDADNLRLERALFGASVFLSDVPLDDRAAVCRCVRPYAYRAGQVVFRQGDEADTFYVVLLGSLGVRVYEEGAAIKESSKRRATKAAAGSGDRESASPPRSPRFQSNRGAATGTSGIDQVIFEVGRDTSGSPSPRARLTMQISGESGLEDDEDADLEVAQVGRLQAGAPSATADVFAAFKSSLGMSRPQTRTDSTETTRSAPSVLPLPSATSGLSLAASLNFLPEDFDLNGSDCASESPVSRKHADDDDDEEDYSLRPERKAARLQMVTSAASSAGGASQRSNMRLKSAANKAIISNSLARGVPNRSPSPSPVVAQAAQEEFRAGATQVCTLHGGSAFGESALSATKQFRVATILALETSYVMVLLREDYHRIRGAAEQAAEVARQDFLSRVPLFGGWQVATVEKMAAMLYRRSHRKNDVVRESGAGTPQVIFLHEGELAIARPLARGALQLPKAVATATSGVSAAAEGEDAADTSKPLPTDGRANAWSAASHWHVVAIVTPPHVLGLLECLDEIQASERAICHSGIGSFYGIVGWQFDGLLNREARERLRTGAVLHDEVLQQRQRLQAALLPSTRAAASASPSAGGGAASPEPEAKRLARLMATTPHQRAAGYRLDARLGAIEEARHGGSTAPGRPETPTQPAEKPRKALALHTATENRPNPFRRGPRRGKDGRPVGAVESGPLALLAALTSNVPSLSEVPALASPQQRRREAATADEAHQRPTGKAGCGIDTRIPLKWTNVIRCIDVRPKTPLQSPKVLAGGGRGDRDSSTKLAIRSSPPWSTRSRAPELQFSAF